MAEMTPMMQQYLETKKEYPDCILFYRLGDFYEMFFEDAITASKELEITLTGKNCGLEERAPMCGIPYHAVDGYLNKLVSRGYKVAICEDGAGNLVRGWFTDEAGVTYYLMPTRSTGSVTLGFIQMKVRTEK